MKRLNTVYIRENSLLARIAARKLRVSSVALTLGNTIHLFNATSEQFQNDNRWVNHELTHVMQFRRHGFLRFIWMYLAESARRGYYNNKFEVEARLSEAD